MYPEGSFLQQFHTEYPGLPGHSKSGTAALLERLSLLLDGAQKALEGGDSRRAFRQMSTPLSALRNDAQALGAEDEFAAAARRHPLFSVMQQDPYTRRAFEKPRGHPGDAATLDFVYDGVPPLGTTPIGKRCFFGTTRGSMGLSIIYRRSVLRAHVDHAVASTDDFRIFSVGSGHCRELEGSLFMETPCQGEFVAFDQDPKSCERVRNVYNDFPVRVEEGQVESLLNDAQTPGTFDLVYAAGLLDYLTTSLASRLAFKLYEMLRPGGRLLLTNVLPDCDGRGYMETMMDWRLIHRSEDQLVNLLPPPIHEQVRTHLDPPGNTVYAEAHRGARS